MFELVSGVRLPVLSDGKPIKGNKIHIGVKRITAPRQEYRKIILENRGMPFSLKVTNHFIKMRMAGSYLGQTEVVMQELEKYIAEAKGAAFESR